MVNGEAFVLALENESVLSDGLHYMPDDGIHDE